MPTPFNETSNGFREEFFFLSNFYEAPVTVHYRGEDFLFLTGEHVFQGMKVIASVNPDGNVAALKALEQKKDGNGAKYWGRSIRIDPSKWDSLSYGCMRRSLELKFSQHPDLMKKLVDTGDIELVEYNNWNDTLWGKNQKTKVGKNQLGELLMELRQQNR